MSSSQFLTDAATRHAVFVQRFAGGRVKKLLKYVKRVESQILARIEGQELTEYTATRLQATLKDLNRLTQSIYKEMGQELTQEMIDFGKYEAEFSKRMFEAGVDAEFVLPSNDVIEAAIKTRPMNVSPGKNGYTIGTSLRQFEKKAAREIVQSIKDGVVLGKTPREIAKDIRNITGNIQSQNVEALVRTTTNHVSTVAKHTTMDENSDVLEGYQIVATLDNRTTIICAGLDGQVFPLSSSRRPPFHWGCRTTTKPKVKSEYDLFSEVSGTRPAVGATGKQEASTRQSFDGWLRGQKGKSGEAFQKEYFSKLPQGEEKYMLWKTGGLHLEKFTDSKNATYTLDQLRDLEPTAFERAKL